MAIAMVAMLAFGGTYAYFTASATGATKTGNTGIISLKNNSTETTQFSIKNILPTESETVALTVVEGSNRGSWVFFTAEATVDGSKETDPTTAELNAALSAITVKDNLGASRTVISFSYTDEGEAGTEDDVTYTVYAVELKDAEVADDATSEVESLTATATVAVTGNANNANGAGHTAMGASITVKINASSIQFAGFEYGTDKTHADASASASAAYAALVAQG